MTNDEIRALLKWSRPSEIRTSQGPRILQSAMATSDFWGAWNADKEGLRAAGIGLKKDENTKIWTVNWWQPIPAEVVAERKATIAESKAASAEIDIPAPPGLTYFPFQKAGIRYILGRFAKGLGCLLGDDMGLGKTVQAIGVVNALGLKRVLVICPASLKPNWVIEFNRWSTGQLRVEIANGNGWPVAADVVIINYDILSKHMTQIKAIEWDLVVCDEAHYIKNYKAARTEAVKEISKVAKRNLRMTGTPIINRTMELYSLINDLDPEHFGNLIRFAKRYAGAVKTEFGWDMKGATNLTELYDVLRANIFCRRTKGEVLTELPAKMRQIIVLPSDGAGSLIAEERDIALRKDADMTRLRAAVELAKAGTEGEYREAVRELVQAAKVAFEDGARVRHQIALYKLPMAIDHLRECMADGRKVVVFAHHLDVIDALFEAGEAEGWHPVRLTGRDTIEVRQWAVETFQGQPSCRLFVGGILAAGVGITLTASSHVVMCELDWRPGVVTQAEDRTHRIGQHESVLIQHLVLAESLDSTMAQVILEKQEIIERALDHRGPDPDLPVWAVRKVDTSATENVSRDKIEKDAAKLTDAQSGAIMAGLRTLAGLDGDRAAELNGIGFSKVDTIIGHSLAGRDALTPKQLALGMLLCNRYRRQLPKGLVQTIQGWQPPKVAEEWKDNAEKQPGPAETVSVFGDDSD